MNVFKNYKAFKAKNQYSYPFLFFIIWAVKNLCQVGALALIIFGAIYVAGFQLGNNETSQAVATTNPTAPNSSQRANDTPYDSKWVFRQSEEKYTIQFASSADKELIYKRARSFSDTDDVTVFPFKKNRDKLFVYGVTVGIYDSVKSAQEAISKLPESLRDSKPWIRSIGELQIQVAKTLDT